MTSWVDTCSTVDGGKIAHFISLLLEKGMSAEIGQYAQTILIDNHICWVFCAEGSRGPSLVEQRYYLCIRDPVVVSNLLWPGMMEFCDSHNIAFSIDYGTISYLHASTARLYLVCQFSSPLCAMQAPMWIKLLKFTLDTKSHLALKGPSGNVTLIGCEHPSIARELCDMLPASAKLHVDHHQPLVECLQWWELVGEGVHLEVNYLYTYMLQLIQKTETKSQFIEAMIDAGAEHLL